MSHSGENKMAATAVEEMSGSAAITVVPTSRFGEVEVRTEKIITMTKPPLGFPESTRFVLLPHKEGSPFMWLQSLDNAALAFVVVQPAVLGLDYQPHIDRHVRQELALAAGAQPDLLLILTIPAGRPQGMTANLLGPLVINVEKKLAKQVILDPTKYDPCWPVLKD